ncbi:serine/threonine-protein kinase KIN2, partial [Borealophlyctis nickersoniae]
MLSGKKYYGPEVDIWSLGVILYVLVCGTLPFDDRHMSRMYGRIMAGKFMFPEGVSESCKDLITKILQVKPHLRATLSDIRTHPWMTDKGCLPPLTFHDAETRDPSPSDVDPRVLSRLVELGFSKEEVE